MHNIQYSVKYKKYWRYDWSYDYFSGDNEKTSTKHHVIVTA